MPRFEGERAAAVDPKIDEIRADAEEQVRLLKNRDGASEYLRAACAHRFARKRGEEQADDEQIGDEE